MSRIAKKPLAIPAGVTVSLADGVVRVQGPKGTLTRSLHPHVIITHAENALVVSVASPDMSEDRALWGLWYRLLVNMITGVVHGFTKKLELVGVGFKAAVSGQKLTLHIGFSHPVVFPLPEGIKAAVEKNTLITLESIDKEALGNTAAQIRLLRKPEPYKGKGIRYAGEVVRRKLGKAAKAAGAGSGAG